MPHPPTSPPPAGDTGPEETERAELERHWDYLFSIPPEEVEDHEWRETATEMRAELAALQARYDDLNAETGRWGIYGVLQRRVEALTADLATLAARAEAAEAETARMREVASRYRHLSTDIPLGAEGRDKAFRLCEELIGLLMYIEGIGYVPPLAGAVAAPGGSGRGEGEAWK